MQRRDNKLEETTKRQQMTQKQQQKRATTINTTTGSKVNKMTMCRQLHAMQSTSWKPLDHS